MTAIGLALFILGCLLGMAQEGEGWPRWVAFIAGTMMAMGFLMAALGVFIWIFRVMP